MRAFLSIHLNEIVQKQVEELQSQLTPELPGVKWTRPANCHLTLKFFGDIDAATEEAIVSCLPAAFESFSPFEIDFKGVGQFPPRGALSVLWVGVNRGAAALTALESAAKEALVEAGVSFDKKPFKPHLTIARAPRSRKVYLRSQKQYESLVVASMQVKNVSLTQSVLDPKGAIYTERKRFELTAE